MSSGANPSDCALSNADATLSFIIPDKQLLCIIKASASMAMWHFSNLNLSIAGHVPNNILTSFPSQYLVMQRTLEPLGTMSQVLRVSGYSSSTFPVRGSLAFSITYIHTQNITASYVGLSLKVYKNGHFKACCAPSPPAIPPTTAALKHNQHNKYRSLALLFVTPILSRLEIYLAAPLYRHSPPHPPLPPNHHCSNRTDCKDQCHFINSIQI